MGTRTQGDHAGNVREPVFSRAGVAEAATTRLCLDEDRTVPVAKRLILDLGRQSCGLRHRLVVLDELGPTAACSILHHRRARCNPEDELLVERTADGCPWKFADQRLRRSEDAPAWATDILPIDEEAWVAARDLNQGVRRSLRALWSSSMLLSARSSVP